MLFICLFASGCGLKVERPKEILVTDIMMPADGEFEPGDRVTVTASGFESGDEIRFEIAWTGGSEEFAPEGWAKGIRGIVTERTAGSITFLAPGHYPPSTVGVQLFRGGIFQTLGTIRVSDGVQHEPFLYTLTPTAAGGTSVARSPMYGSADMREEVLTTGLTLDYAVGSIGTGTACGMADGRLVDLDLVTRHTQESGDGALLAGSISASAVAALYVRDDRLYLSGGTSQPYSWQLPEGVTAERIYRQPFDYAYQALMLTVLNDDGTFSPLRRLRGAARSGRCVGIPAPLLDHATVGRRSRTAGARGRLCRTAREHDLVPTPRPCHTGVETQIGTNRPLGCRPGAVDDPVCRGGGRFVRGGVVRDDSARGPDRRDDRVRRPARSLDL